MSGVESRGQANNSMEKTEEKEEPQRIKIEQCQKKREQPFLLIWLYIQHQPNLDYNKLA